ncbi:Lipid A export ATP-binding/permease protein MsbA [Myxococcus hansupus]|uniref:Lipid A export ATP-binding/permease protein MsbA n=1 Tax=Pseudomyxococcus hansupus TaxID=1297742 RepID=A0A0H4WWE5_9BACT|nr:peptidase domain-containing ABC transporter [Myxococcus hansupus]AKQ65938.1 Lipid A export ATP-binding/permease protein MsbA [Myxococcus hansupus]
MSADPKPGLLQRFPALKRLKPGGRARIPDVRQMTLTDCGPACLAMVLAYHGRDMSLDQVREFTGASRDGTTAKSLIASASKLGLRGRGVSIDVDKLAYLPPASVLHWNFSHYVVFERLDKNSVHVVDPAVGRRQVSMEQFRQYFTGVALVFEPREDFQPGSTRRGAYRYLMPLLRQHGTLTRIVVVSLALQLFALAVPMLTGMVVDRVVPRGDVHLLLVLSSALMTLVVFQLLASLLRGHLLLELRTRVDAGMTLGFLEHLVSLAYPFFQLRPSGDLMMRMGMQSTVRETISATAISSLLDGALVLLYLLLLFIAAPLMGLLVLLLGGLQVFVIIYSGKQRSMLLSQNLELDAKAQTYQIAMLSGMQTLKAFGGEDRAVQGYSNLFVDILNIGLKRGRLNLWVDSLTKTLQLAAPLLLLSVGTYLVLNKSLTLGEMLSINALAGALLVPLSNLVGTVGQFQLLGSYLERINDVLDAPPERTPSTASTQAQLKGGITLEGVSFRYHPNSAPVVHDVSVRIHPGQMVAIVGRSGAGKSTLANLLLGLYLPTSGRVRYDEMDLSDLDLRAVRGQMGCVLQEPAFFGASIRDNISLNDPEMSLDQVKEAATLAQIHDDIMAMPLQYATPMVDRGLSLSGGQRQRLALARALARNPSVLLLDEATSALDAVTEVQVQRALGTLSCTRVVIAHRLSTIRTADVILVMEGGRVVETGSHQELLSRNGTYFALVQAQVEPDHGVSRLG